MEIDLTVSVPKFDDNGWDYSIIDILSGTVSGTARCATTSHLFFFIINKFLPIILLVSFP